MFCFIILDTRKIKTGTLFKLTVNNTVQLHLQYNYNSVKLLDNIQDMLDNGSVIESYEYTLNGLISKKTTAKTNVTVDYENNSAGQVKKITVKKGNTVIGQYEYSYYANGNMKDKKEIVNSGALKTTEYEYDGLGRLVTENSGNTSMKYAYDRSGNRSSMKVTGTSQPYTTSYTYDKNNRMTKETKTYSTGGNREETEYYYDPNGNMISKASGKWEKTIGSMSFSMQPTTTKGSGVYEYNGFNQLVSLYESATNSTCSYTYDADGLRQSKTVNGVTTKHTWDGMNMVAETNGSNAVTSVYTRGKKLISSKKGTAVTYYLHNGHGDVNMLMNESGSITKTYTYDAFGVEQNKASSDTNPFRYCGEYYDKETDNIYLRARYYSPAQGRFTTEDPAEDGLNWYSYCAGNPIAFVDPMGLTSQEDYDAYQQGRLTYSDLRTIERSTDAYNNAKRANDSSGMIAAHKMAVGIRQNTYDNNAIQNDNFDYTFGTGYNCDDDGSIGMFAKMMGGVGDQGAVVVKTVIVYQRYEQNGKKYLSLLYSNTDVDTSSGFKVISLTMSMGQNAIGVLNQVITMNETSYHKILWPNNDWKGVADTGGEMDSVGINAEVYYRRGNNLRKVVVVNQVNYQEFYSDTERYEPFKMVIGIGGRTQYDR